MERRTAEGFAWLVYPNAVPPGDETHPGLPFPGEAARGGDLPPGIVDFWPVSAELGLEDDRSGVSALVVTDTPDPPRIERTYKAAPAALYEGYQAGGGLVRVTRVLRTAEGPHGVLRECEFDVGDETPDLLAPEVDAR